LGFQRQDLRKEQRDIASKIAHFGIITCSHNYQIQDRAVAVITLTAPRQQLAHLPRGHFAVPGLQLRMCNSSNCSFVSDKMNYKDTAKASKLHKALSIYMERDSPYPKKL